jgi:hypothetical protein
MAPVVARQGLLALLEQRFGLAGLRRPQGLLALNFCYYLRHDQHTLPDGPSLRTMAA